MSILNGRKEDEPKGIAIGPILAVAIPILIEIGKVVIPLIIKFIKDKKDEDGKVSFQSPL